MPGPLFSQASWTFRTVTGLSCVPSEASVLSLEGIGGLQRGGSECSLPPAGPVDRGAGPLLTRGQCEPRSRQCLSLLPCRADLSGSLSPTSGARRRTSCPQPRARRRPPRTSRCSRPRPPPPVSPGHASPLPARAAVSTRPPLPLSAPPTSAGSPRSPPGAASPCFSRPAEESAARVVSPPAGLLGSSRGPAER